MSMTPLEELRHSASHVLATAVLRLFPDAKLDIGPPTDTGFYYDIDLDHKLTTEDLEKIEAEMKKIAEENQRFDRKEVSREEAIEIIKSRGQERYKLGRLADIPEGELNRITIMSKTQTVFYETLLEPIGLLSNDTLADFDFPGQKRLRNFMLVARPDVGPLAGHDALVVVSLLASKKVELRVMGRGEVTDEPCPTEVVEDGGVPPTKSREYFGLFRMKRP